MNQQHLDENLIGYLVGALDEDTRAEVHAQIHSDADVHCRLEQLRLTLEPLAADKVNMAPPKDLAVRTIARIAEYCSLNLPHAPEAVARSTPLGSRWRRADFIVAAAVVLLAVVVGLPALFRLRGPGMGAALAECKNNMRELNVGLQAFKDVHHEFPSVVVEKPRDAAGMVVPILADAGAVLEPASLCCPGSNSGVTCPMTLEQLGHLIRMNSLSKQVVLFPATPIPSDIATKPAIILAPWYPKVLQSCDFPLLADAPPADGGLGNSNNHGGTGQNVLFADGHVRFVSLRTIGMHRRRHLSQ